MTAAVGRAWIRFRDRSAPVGRQEPPLLTERYEVVAMSQTGQVRSFVTVSFRGDCTIAGHPEKVTMVRTLAVSLLATMVSGCLPIPNIHYFAPEVSGVVIQDGHPAEGAEVRVAGQFSSDAQSGSASRDGRFSVKPIREFRFTALLVGDPLYSYTVQLVVGGKRYDGYQGFGMGDAPRALSLVCDLSHPIALGNKQVYCATVNAPR
jgi:hypothetical protein